MLERTLTQGEAIRQEDICVLLRKSGYARNIRKGEFE